MSFHASVTDKRRDEDYDEQVEETLQDEVNDPQITVVVAIAQLKSHEKVSRRHMTSSQLKMVLRAEEEMEYFFCFLTQFPDKN